MRRQLQQLGELELPTPPRALPDQRTFQAWLAERYDVKDRAGQGTTSLVQRATRRSDGLEVALKIMVSTDQEMVDFVRNEFEMLRRHEHPHIIKAIDFCMFKGRAMLVLEYFDGLALNALLKSKASGRLPEGTVRGLLRSLLETVSHLHMHRVLHRDIKAENVLVSRDARDLRLIDFNTACCLSAGDSLTPTGTRLHAAPEVVLGESPSEGADVWGAGACAYLMLSGRLPQSRERCSNLLQLREAVCRPVEFSGSCWDHVSEPCKAMLRRCLSLNLRQRPMPGELLDMSWFSNPPREDGVTAPPHRIIENAFRKCPLLPGLEPAVRSRPQMAACHSEATPTTDAVSSRCSTATSPKPAPRRAACRDAVEAEEPAPPTAQRTAGELLDPGSRVVIRQPPALDAGSFNLQTRVGTEALILMVNITERIYKVRFADGSVRSIPIDHAGPGGSPR